MIMIITIIIDEKVAARMTLPLNQVSESRSVGRVLVPIVLAALAVWPGGLGELTRALMTDAYVQVSVFVALTLLAFYGAERLFGFRIGDLLAGARSAQVPLAALLGATPGCGGAVVVVAAYSSGHVGFGAVVATLTATMGDAAFLLIATRPRDAMLVLPLSFAVGILSGWVVDRFGGVEPPREGRAVGDIAPRIGAVRLRDLLYLVPLAPGLVIGGGQLAGIEVTHVLGVPPVAIGLVGTFAGLWIWSTSPLKAMSHPEDAPVSRMAEETSFISVWVIGAYLAYDYLAEFGGLDLALLFDGVAPLLPLMAILVGFVPGCGPQVLVTTLYINGLVPFAALVGNAISNDGDALFPAIALNPRAAVLATAYSAVPALIVGYVLYFFADGAPLAVLAGP